jgi:hypothetical protein
MSSVRPAAVLLLVAVVAGCGSSSSSGETTTAPAPSKTTTRVAAPPKVKAPDPGKALRDFVQAAGSENAQRMWTLLSRPTRARWGPTLARFRSSVATDLSEGVGSFAHSKYSVVLSQRITGVWAVAAIAGERSAEGTRSYDAYATALRLEGNAWRVELGGPVQLRLLRPDPGEIVKRRTQLAVEVRAPSLVDQAGIWLDGRAVRGTYGGTGDGRRLTVFSESRPLRPGHHTAVVFASAGSNASALGWAFSSR